MQSNGTLKYLILGAVILGCAGLSAWWLRAPSPADESATERLKPGETSSAEQRQPAREAMRAAEGASLVKAGRAVYLEFECGNCHKIGAEGWKKRKGPVLDNIGGLVTAEQIKDKVMATASWYAEGFEKEFNKQTMPDDYGERMTPKEMKTLIAYLMTLKDPAGKTPKPVFNQE